MIAPVSRLVLVNNQIVMVTLIKDSQNSPLDFASLFQHPPTPSASPTGSYVFFYKGNGLQFNQNTIRLLGNVPIPVIIILLPTAAHLF